MPSNSYHNVIASSFPSGGPRDSRGGGRDGYEYVSRGRVSGMRRFPAPTLPPRKNYGQSEGRRFSPPGSGPSRSPYTRHRSPVSQVKPKRQEHFGGSHRRTSPAPSGGHVYIPHYWPTRTGDQVISAAQLRQVFPHLYVPSTFSHALIPSTIYSMEMSLFATTGSHFYVLDRKVDKSGGFSKKLASCSGQPTPITDCPSYRHGVKVMLLSVPSASDVIKRCTDLAEGSPPSSVRSSGIVHQTKLVSFLQGIKEGKPDPLGIGGYWHPEVDGSHPDKDPTVLIKTAIRCTREQTGIDLSRCNQWYKIVELRYLRPEYGTSAGSAADHDNRIESTTVLLPDVWSIMPSESEWTAECESLTKLLNEYERDISRTSGESTEKTASSASGDAEHDPPLLHQADDATENAVLASSTQVVKQDDKNSGGNIVLQTTLEESNEEMITVDEVIDDCSMEVKSDIISPAAEAGTFTTANAKPEPQRVVLDLPQSPHILVNPSRTIKDGSFDCKLSSLSSLLDYNPSPTKEHAFELSVFAELFNHCVAHSHAVTIASTLSRINPADSLNPSAEGRKDGVLERSCTPAQDEDGSSARKRARLASDSEKKVIASDSTTGVEEKLAHVGTVPVDKGDGSSDGNGDKTENGNINKHAVEQEKETNVESQRHPNKPINFPNNKPGYSKESSGYRTTRPELLLAFSYFDHRNFQTLSRKDISNILEAVNNCMPRAQIGKLIDGACGLSQSTLYYRNLTDALWPENVQIWPLSDSDTLGSLSGFPMKQAEPKALDGREHEISDVAIVDGRTVNLKNLLNSVDATNRTINELNIKIKMQDSEIVNLRSINTGRENQIKSYEQTVESMKETLAERKKALFKSRDSCSKYESCLSYTRYTLKRLLSRELDQVLGDRKDSDPTAKSSDLPDQCSVSDPPKDDLEGDVKEQVAVDTAME